MKPSIKYLFLLAPFLPIVFLLASKIPAITNSLTEMQLSFSLLGLFIVSVATMIAYGLHMWNNSRMSRDEKVNWIFFFILFMLGAQIAYWFRFIRRDNEQRIVPQ